MCFNVSLTFCCMHFLSLWISAALLHWPTEELWIIQASVCFLMSERDRVTAGELRHKHGVRISTQTCSVPHYITLYIIFKSRGCLRGSCGCKAAQIHVGHIFFRWKHSYDLCLIHFNCVLVLADEHLLCHIKLIYLLYFLFLVKFFISSFYCFVVVTQ